MTTFFISRHPGAHEWAKRQGFDNVEVVIHFDPSITRPGDVVLGTLPVHLAAVVCSQGGQFNYLKLDLPSELRGEELTADDMERLGARLVHYHVAEVGLTHWVLRDAITCEPYITSPNQPEFADMPVQWQGRESYWVEESI